MGMGQSSYAHQQAEGQEIRAAHGYQPAAPHKDLPPAATVSTFGQQKGADVLDTSQYHYQFQGSMSAPHF